MKSLGRKASGVRLERMKASSRWVDGAFRNVHPLLPGLRANVPMPLWEFFCPKEQRTPLAPLPIVDPLPIWRRPPESGFRTTVLGHSTVLFEIDGARVLTDPVWSARASPTRRAGPKRFQPMPVELAALPPLDVILLSHDHYDHLDYWVIRELAKSDVPFVAPLGVGAHLEAWGVAPERITEVDWWESVELPGRDLRITATPAQHFSGRGPGMRNQTLWASYVLQGPTHRVFFGADTGLTREYEAIRGRFHPFDLVLLEIGAFHPAWGDIHLGPERALTALDFLGGGRLLPIHWGTFDLAPHRWDQPIETLVRLGAERGDRLLVPKRGDPVEPAAANGFETWWREVAALHGPPPPDRTQAAAAAADSAESSDPVD
jgi:L-ascorbate metabolism protein UlaG (beta-lactamase superfamily)